MTDLQRAILQNFDEYVFGFMRSDIDAAIRGNANYLAALGLVSYTEVLGGLVTGKLGVVGQSGVNFRAFLPYLGSQYKQLESKGIDLYDIVRCGLVHNYFIKGESTIHMHAVAPCGIVASPGGPTYFYVNVYRDHFFAGAARYRNDILDEPQPDLALKFQTGMKNIAIKIP
ncbi:MAG: hypothetical protein V3T23_12560 [Nitrososphaerales archaeon]